MGKLVKYCAVCEESFAEKFSFCPNCAAALTAYEMNPVGGELTSSAPPSQMFENAPEVPAEEFKPAVRNFDLPEPAGEIPKEEPVERIFEPTAPAFLTNSEVQSVEEIAEIEDERAGDPVYSSPAITASAIAAPQSFEDYQQTYQSASTYQDNYVPTRQNVDKDGFYSVTMVEEKNSGVRNMLLLGSTILVLGFSLVSVVFSIYNADAYVGALNDDLSSIVFAPSDEPTEIEEIPEPKNNDKGGGGGGGGNKDPNPVSKGQLASQSEKPLIAPSVTMDRVTKPDIPIRMETQGTRKEVPTNDPYGNPQSKFNIASDGGGSGGGQGEGTGRGQGNGRGTGAGNGDGSGNGNGIGNGNGNGRGNGDNGRDEGNPPPTIKTGPTVGLQITSKPRANYTDAARQAQVQGTVTLRVTFNANGTIGSISPVSGLPNGLTEQAIAAARSIRFTPAMQNGIAKTVVKQVQYTFTLY